MGENPMATDGKGSWWPVIPHPIYGVRKQCHCGAKFWTLNKYRFHYVTEHVIYEELKEAPGDH